MNYSHRSRRLRRVSVTIAAVTAMSLFSVSVAEAQSSMGAEGSPGVSADAVEFEVPAEDAAALEVTAEEEKAAEKVASAISSLPVSESNLLTFMELAAEHPIPADQIERRLAKVPESATAEQVAKALYPDNESAQNSLKPILESTSASPKSGAASIAGFDWGDTWKWIKFGAKCGGAIGTLVLSLVPAGATVKVTRAIALIKKYGTKKAVNILWRFAKGKGLDSKQRAFAKVLIGITSISIACTP
ncbi:hypothetical protein HUT18_09850 [Streptomyces sp. NA04227]|uniref:hypothetical protein n=1 Tax=Streptomyces sp. NA04227 TaxID=2742136 RepID=UPI00158FD19B|nr:hypothetical protein [Streptomyces sp. NA04227]QKW06661.1 hypothetical protein HUT18_09850 [Streptomyces sp. NA04227]